MLFYEFGYLLSAFLDFPTSPPALVFDCLPNKCSAANTYSEILLGFFNRAFVIETRQRTRKTQARAAHTLI